MALENLENKRRVSSQFAYTLILGAILIIALILLDKWQEANNKQHEEQPAITSTTTKSEIGQIVTGLPKEFILDKLGTVTQSYSIDYSNGLEQFTASFQSTMSVKAIYNSYIQLLQAKKFIFFNKVLSSTSASIYAKDSNEQTVSIAVSMKNSKVYVVVNYLKGK